jgi:hypothetical protein
VIGELEAEKVRFGETPKPTPETGALPDIRGRNHGLAARSIVICFLLCPLRSDL